MVMKKAAWNGPGRNVNVITVLPAENRFLEVHNVVEPAKNQWQTNWMDHYDPG